MPHMRLDKWLWAARFFKTRSLAVQAVSAGRVLVNRQAAKPARLISVGDIVSVHKPGLDITVRVRGLSPVRGPAARAAELYAETPESVAERERLAEQRRLAPEPGWAYEAGRPTKRDRRQMDQWRGR
ncbi:MAG: RNA-binding S4 domain-containing protein [Burkholderiaceae bacterium]|uniref:RNA-binding S4 domain-containing protein n=1 Tax=Castellaniella sp. TaxID=1955812 RepID=UPI00355EA4C7